MNQEENEQNEVDEMKKGADVHYSLNDDVSLCSTACREL